MIRKCPKKDKDPKRPVKEQEWCLYTKDGDKLLGRHPSKEKAKDQETAIQISKHSNKLKLLIKWAVRGLLNG